MICYVIYSDAKFSTDVMLPSSCMLLLDFTTLRCHPTVSGFTLLWNCYSSSGWRHSAVVPLPPSGGTPPMSQCVSFRRHPTAMSFSDTRRLRAMSSATLRRNRAARPPGRDTSRSLLAAELLAASSPRSFLFTPDTPSSSSSSFYTTTATTTAVTGLTFFIRHTA